MTIRRNQTIEKFNQLYSKTDEAIKFVEETIKRDKELNGKPSCTLCDKELTPGGGCEISAFYCKGKKYKRIKVGDKLDFDIDSLKNGMCNNCTAGVGQCHHSNCDVERCPVCLQQLVGCKCKIAIKGNKEAQKPTRIAVSAFDPTNYEIKDRVYGDTGGGCTAVTLEVYLPEIKKRVWANCDGRGVDITTVDVIWGENHADAYDCSIIYVSLDDDNPNEVKQWFTIMQEALAYYIDQTLSDARMRSFVSVPVEWLPDVVLKNADPDYLKRLRKMGKKASISKKGNFIEWKNEPDK
jgi:hypothetical protein